MSWIGATIYKIRCQVRVAIIKSRFKRSIEKHIPVIVFQMGKVGSSSIYQSLKKFYPGIVLHRHSLDEKTDWQAQLLLEHAITHKKPLKIISLVREPVSRNISAFFQNFEVITGIKPENANYTTQQLLDIFLSNPAMDHTAPLNWFTENIQKHFGINIYEYPFPSEGWCILKNIQTEVLLMKLEISDEVKTEQIREFLNLKNFKLIASNVAENKGYANMYTSFIKNISLPASYVNSLHSSPKVTYFYTAQEIEKANKKWTVK